MKKLYALFLLAILIPLHAHALFYNEDIASGAAIDYSKLNLAGDIKNSDVATSAAIAYSKLALTGDIVNADISSSAAIAYAKLLLTSSIVNGDISSSAAIALSKLATQADQTFLGNVSGGSAVPIALTTTQMHTALADVTGVGTFGSSPTANGATVSSNNIILQPADGTHPGSLSTTTQTIPGAKTMAASLTAAADFAVQQTADTSTGTVTALSSSGTSSIRLTASTTMILQGIANGANGKYLTLSNQTGNALTVQNQNAGATAANRVITGTSSDMTISNGAQIFLNYDSTLSRWEVIGGSGGGTNPFIVNQSTGTVALTQTIANDTGTGTTVNKLAKFSSGKAVISTVTDTLGVVGVVASGAGTSGNAEIATGGQVSCIFDGATTAGDYVVPSTSVAAECHDAGSTMPAATQILGNALSTNGSGGTYSMSVFPGQQVASVQAGGMFLGSVTISNCSGEFSTTGTSFGALSTETSCTYATAGTAQAPSTLIAGIKFASIPAGDLSLEYEGAVDCQTANKQCNFQFSDGTNVSRENSSFYQLTSQTFWSGFKQSISYSSAQGATTLQVFGKVASGGTAGITGGGSNTGVIKVYWFPNASSQNTNFFANGNYGSISYLPTYTSFGTVVTSNMFQDKDGEKLHVHGTLIAATTAGAVGGLSLPSGLNLDTTKVPANTTSNPGMKVGTLICSGGSSQSAWLVTAAGTSTNTIYMTSGTAAATPLTPTNINTVCGSGNTVSVDFTVSIAGWATSPVSVTSVQGPRNQLYYYTGAYGSGSSVKVLHLSTQDTTNSKGSQITYVSDSVNGDTFIVNSSGNYGLGLRWDIPVATAVDCGFTRNYSTLTTAIGSVPAGNRLLDAGLTTGSTSYQGYLDAGDVIRYVCDGGSIVNSAGAVRATITQLSF